MVTKWEQNINMSAILFNKIRTVFDLWKWNILFRVADSNGVLGIGQISLIFFLLLAKNNRLASVDRTILCDESKTVLGCLPNVLCAYCDHLDMLSVSGLSCAGHDILLFVSHHPWWGHTLIRQYICIALWITQSVISDHMQWFTPPIPANHLKPYFNWSIRYPVVSLHP